MSFDDARFVVIFVEQIVIASQASSCCNHIVEECVIDVQIKPLLCPQRSLEFRCHQKCDRGEGFAISRTLG